VTGDSRGRVSKTGQMVLAGQIGSNQKGKTYLEQRKVRLAFYGTGIESSGDPLEKGNFFEGKV